MFISIEPKDILDIILVALLLYYVYKLMKESRSLNIFIGIMIFVVIWILVSHILEMRLLGSIMDKVVSVGVIALIILFQDDIRHFLYNLGARRKISFLARLFSFNKKDNGEKTSDALMPVVMACMSMSKRKEGALIVIARESSLADVVKTGDIIDAQVNQRLIENIFFKNSPLHDGAMVIIGTRIQAAGCILPVSHDLNIPKELGLRHRAALGMSQASDAVIIVVSEETGSITVAINGTLQQRLSAEKLESILAEVL